MKIQKDFFYGNREESASPEKRDSKRNTKKGFPGVGLEVMEERGTTADPITDPRGVFFLKETNERNEKSVVSAQSGTK